MLHISVVDASLDDVSVINFIQSKTWLNSYVNDKEGITSADIEAKIEEWNQDGDQRIVEELKKPGSHTWVAKDGDRVIGFAAALKTESGGSIEALHVLPAYQGQGIGSELLKKVLKWLEDRKITMEVVAYNLRAQKLYKKYGFHIIGPALNDPIILPSGKRIPKLLMVKGGFPS